MLVGVCVDDESVLMIICPACDSRDVMGGWEQGLSAPVWGCRACGHHWPVTRGDRVAAEVREHNRRAVDGVVEVCKRAKWSTGGTEEHE